VSHWWCWKHWRQCVRNSKSKNVIQGIIFNCTWWWCRTERVPSEKKIEFIYFLSPMQTWIQ
jgi:hypothetical protein